jgi:hypothetical protein
MLKLSNYCNRPNFLASGFGTDYKLFQHFSAAYLQGKAPKTAIRCLALKRFS